MSPAFRPAKAAGEPSAHRRSGRPSAAPKSPECCRNKVQAIRTSFSFVLDDYFAVMHPTSQQAKEESVRLVQNLQTFDILRAERCFSAHGLELRVPFLDRDVINYVLRLPGWMRLPFQNIEKWILREAFRDLGLPDRIANRQKERMSDGVGYGWVPSLINHSVNQLMSSEGLTTDQRISSEKDYYRQVYNKIFKNDLIIQRVMPAWAVAAKGQIMAY